MHRGRITLRVVLGRRVEALAAVLLIFLSNLAAQQPAFRAGVDLIEVNVVVTDRSGTPVRGLTAGDFEVLDERRPQTIAAFGEAERSVEPLTPSTFAMLPVPADVRSNVATNRRVYALVLDGQHIDAERTARIRVAAKQFVGQALGANDTAAVVLTNEPPSADLTSQFTDNRPRLINAIDRFNGGKLRTAPQVALSGSSQPSTDPLANDGPQLRRDDPLDAERSTRARASLVTLRNLADALGDTRGERAAIVFISEGMGEDSVDWGTSRAARTIRDELKRTVEAASRAGVGIYAIDARALVSRGASSAVAQEPLRTLAEDTGAFAALTANDAATAFDRIVAESSSYYTLGFVPSDSREGRYHSLEVRLKRRGLRVRARRGYMLPRPDMNSRSAATLSALRRAINSPLSIGGLPMSIFAAPFKGTGANATVIVCYEWPAGDANFAVRAPNNTLEVEILALDGTGQVHGGAHHTASLTFDSQSVEETRQHGLRLMSQLDVPPGRYQLRIAAAEAAGSTAGSVLYDLAVPDFAQDRLSMSGVSIYSWPEPPAQLTTGAEAPMSAVLPFPPTLRRTFTRRDQLTLFAEVYERTSAAPEHTLSFSGIISSPDGRELVRDGEQWSSRDPRGHRGEYGVQARLPLASLPPGVYIVRAEARSDAAGQVTREFPIRIE